MRAGWNKKTLGELCDIARGGSPRPIQSYLTDDPKGVNWIKISDATASGKYIFRTEQKIRKEGVSRSRMVKEGDFLLSNSMSFGRPYIMKTTGCIHDGWLVLSDKSGLFDQDFLYHFLGSEAAFKQFDSLASGSTVRNLNIDLAKRVSVPVPPLAEQRRIVDILDEAFAGLEAMRANAEKNLQNARDIFDCELSALCAKRGKGWIEAKIGDIAGTQYGLSLPMNEEGKGYKIFRMGEVQDGRLLDTGRMKFADIGRVEFEKYRLHAGDVLFNRTNSYELVGKTGVFELEGDYCFASYLIRLLVDRKRISPYLLNYIMNSPPFQTRIKARASRSVSQANVNATVLSNELIRFPQDLREQSSVVMRLDELKIKTQRLQSVYNKKLAAIDELKQSILQKAFSGELTSAGSIAA